MIGADLDELGATTAEQRGEVDVRRAVVLEQDPAAAEVLLHQPHDLGGGVRLGGPPVDADAVAEQDGERLGSTGEDHRVLESRRHRRDLAGGGGGCEESIGADPGLEDREVERRRDRGADRGVERRRVLDRGLAQAGGGDGDAAMTLDERRQLTGMAGLHQRHGAPVEAWLHVIGS